MNEKKVLNSVEAEIINFDTLRKIDDPLRDLLEEFSHLETEMDVDLDKINQSSKEYLCSDLTDEEMVCFFETRMDLLEESRKRLKFYLDEIETFLIHK
ncbi:MAG: hypothetical protein A2381_12490 [Bdellovibrionales bacterium RIFOXYB1_FULL_37_110]|nr:MAG: hypothetical protein A2181_07215 [Bdellovibrionales bacterium RIFOXYA1_FULL_38_20]OFZ51503.1 MAG: hypothetical protein A2417_12175 [Bdellovibrionales bacterium RIFOXYC1_FULL_37_79]OFZ60337.1 MAG: hypothetical protein A2381_12490 [Bdellovibrionales bacterium RIFOXYB1_FULL_37_110]OFZ63827.1 MAG: hypothetical protein A2577_05405 [Bdellovibrionales bacterium RIFOXYD1_FULL_36_51]